MMYPTIFLKWHSPIFKPGECVNAIKIRKPQEGGAFAFELRRGNKRTCQNALPLNTKNSTHPVSTRTTDYRPCTAR